LHSIRLPYQLELIDGSAFAQSGIAAILVDEQNRNFTVCDTFLLDFDRISVIRYFGFESEVSIPGSIQQLACGCFSYCNLLSQVSFDPAGQISLFDERAFTYSSLEAICIPASVEVIGSNCFEHCQRLSSVIFEAGSNLSVIREYGFSNCSSLTAICIPASVESLCDKCFAYCAQLASVVFERDSQLSAIDPSSFGACGSLTSLCIPVSIVVVCERDLFQLLRWGYLTLEVV
jgi:hypothetical protein